MTAEDVKESKGSKSEPALGIGAVVAIVLCCATPLLIAGGALGAIGAFFSNPMVIVLGVALVAGAFVWATRHVRQRGQRDGTSLPTNTPRRGHEH
jgi:hypothetical protein